MYIWAAPWQNQQSGMCAQRRLRSAQQSDQSLRCPPEESLGPLGCPGWSESSLGAHATLLVLSCGASFSNQLWYSLFLSPLANSISSSRPNNRVLSRWYRASSASLGSSNVSLVKDFTDNGNGKESSNQTNKLREIFSYGLNGFNAHFCFWCKFF